MQQCIFKENFINSSKNAKNMKVAVLYSGGKDSTAAIDFCMQRGWEIAYLLSVKPTRKDCFLFHFATVEHTKELAEILGLRHLFISCSVADPKKEAELVKQVVEQNKVDAVVLGGTGLQETQIRSIQNALQPLGVKAFAAHQGREHGELFKSMIAEGYEILVTQVASDGLNKWLGRIITKENFPSLEKESLVYGFHIGFEGGYADTLVLDAPFFTKKLQVEKFHTVWDDPYCGHLIIDKIKLLEKIKV